MNYMIFFLLNLILELFILNLLYYYFRKLLLIVLTISPVSFVKISIKITKIFSFKVRLKIFYRSDKISLFLFLKKLKLIIYNHFIATKFSKYNYS